MRRARRAAPWVAGGVVLAMVVAGLVGALSGLG